MGQNGDVGFGGCVFIPISKASENNLGLVDHSSYQLLVPFNLGDVNSRFLNLGDVKLSVPTE